MKVVTVHGNDPAEAFGAVVFENGRVCAGTVTAGATMSETKWWFDLPRADAVRVLRELADEIERTGE